MQPRKHKVILQKIIGCYDELAGKEDFLLRFKRFVAVRKIMNDSVEK